MVVEEDGGTDYGGERGWGDGLWWWKRMGGWIMVVVEG